MCSEAEQLCCFDLCFGSSFEASFTDPRDEVGSPVVVLAHLVYFGVSIASACQYGAACEIEGLEDVFLVIVSVFKINEV